MLLCAPLLPDKKKNFWQFGRAWEPLASCFLEKASVPTSPRSLRQPQQLRSYREKVPEQDVILSVAKDAEHKILQTHNPATWAKRK